MSDPSGSRDYGRFDELADEFAERYRRGEVPSLQEFVDRLPEMADEIREMFPALVEVERAEGAARESAHLAPPAALSRHRQIGDYRIVREVGRGGMGVVYEAEQVSLGRRVALKVLPGHVVGDRKALDRFRREAKAAARLHHTNIVPVFEVGRDGDVAFYAMQFILGQGLDQVIDELRRLRDPGQKSVGNVPIGASGTGPALGIPASGRQNRMVGRVAESLLSGRLGTERWESFAGDASARIEAAEAKPSDPAATIDAESRDTGGFDLEIPPAAHVLTSAVMPGGTAVSMVESSGRRQPFFRSVAQIGFQAAQGLAHAHARGIVHRDIKPSNLLLDTAGVVWITDFGLAKAEEDGLTASGDILGTLRYMAPERFRGEGDARVDIYALGLTLYELLTLRPAYNLTDRMTLIEQIKAQEPARPRLLDGRIPRDLETIVLKAIEKDRNRRYQTIDAMAEDLRRFLADEPIQARRTSTVERYVRWARRNPSIAVLGGVVTGMLVLATVASLAVASRLAHLANREQRAALSERSARQEASRNAQAETAARAEADKARAASEESRAAAEAETYRAVLGEARALRAGHQPGWRDEALRDLARLVEMPTPRRELSELRTEAVAALGTPDIHLVAKVELPGELGSFTFSPDGQTLLTADRSTGLDFWDLARRSYKSSVEGLAVGKLGFNTTVYLPDGQRLAVGTRDHGVVFTDAKGIRTADVPITEGSSVPTNLAISSDGRRIAVAWTDEGGITVHDVATGARVDRFNASRFALSPDGRWLACEENSEIVLRPIASNEPRVVLDHHGGIRTLAFSPDGTMLAGAFFDHTTVLWDLAKRERFGTLRGHHERVFDVAFSPDGEWIATASLDYTARIWEARTGQNVATLSGSVAVNRVQWSPTGDFLAIGSNDLPREVLLYSITGRRGVRKALIGHRVELCWVAAHPQLDRFATGGYSELMSWDLSASRPSAVAMEPNPGWVTCMAFSADGSLLATGCWRVGSDPRGVIVIRDTNTGKVLNTISGPDILYALAFNPTGELLAYGELGGNVVVWDLATSCPVQTFVTGSKIGEIVFLARPRSLVTHGKNSVLMFNLETGGLERKVEFPGEDVRMFAADRLRSRLVVGFASGAIRSLSLPDLTPGPRLEHAHDGSVDCLDLSADGRLLATGGADRRVVLRDAVSLKALLELPLWVGNLRRLAFDFKGRRLAIVGTDCDVELWDIAALNEGLTALGLAWDRPARAVIPASVLGPADQQLSPAVQVIRRR